MEIEQILKIKLEQIRVIGWIYHEKPLHDCGILVLGLLPRQVQPCNGSGSQSSARINKHEEVLKQEEQERMMRAEEKNKSETKDILHQQKKNRRGFNQEPLGPSIYKEERILRLMEEEEAPSGSGKAQ